MNILQKMLHRVGKTETDYGRNTKMGKVFRRKGVRASSEFNRIFYLPRRKWEEQESLAEDLTDWLKTPQGQMQLRPIQAAALTDLHDFGGLFAPIRVGGGKTLISFLAAEVLDSKRPLLLIPAKLKKKTEHEINQLKEHWRFRIPKIVTYEWLGRMQAADVEDDQGNLVTPGFLRRYAPDLIIADECHKLRHLTAAVTKRVGRYLHKNSEQVHFVAMSGTITKRSLKDYAHICEWALGEKLSPVPTSWPILSEWADALDEKIEANKRLAPGVLFKFCMDEDKEDDPISTVRKGFRRRVIETPGVVSTKETLVDCSIDINEVKPKLGSFVVDAFRILREDWETLDGWPIADAPTVWRHARELVCGFYYIWDPRPPKDWLDARREWCAFVRKVIKRGKYDTELQVAQALKRGKVKDEKRQDEKGLVYDSWKKLRDTFEPNTKPVWIDDGCLKFCTSWMQEHPGLVWVEHVAFGKELAVYSGRPYHHQKGLDEKGVLLDQKTPEDGAVIVSVAANSEGRNLQAWNENLVVSSPPSGDVWEQMIGRTHRDGQQSDEVIFDVIISCIEQWAGFQQAIADARYIQDTTGQPQKILIADVSMMDAQEAAQLSGSLWKK